MSHDGTAPIPRDPAVDRLKKHLAAWSSPPSWIASKDVDAPTSDDQLDELAKWASQLRPNQGATVRDRRVRVIVAKLRDEDPDDAASIPPQVVFPGAEGGQRTGPPIPRQAVQPRIVERSARALVVAMAGIAIILCSTWFGDPLGLEEWGIDESKAALGVAILVFAMGSISLGYRPR